MSSYSESGREWIYCTSAIFFKLAFLGDVALIFAAYPTSDFFVPILDLPVSMIDFVVLILDLWGFITDLAVYLFGLDSFLFILGGLLSSSFIYYPLIYGIFCYSSGFLTWETLKLDA